MNTKSTNFIAYSTSNNLSQDNKKLQLNHTMTQYQYGNGAKTMNRGRQHLSVAVCDALPLDTDRGLHAFFSFSVCSSSTAGSHTWRQAHAHGSGGKSTLSHAWLPCCASRASEAFLLPNKSGLARFVKFSLPFFSSLFSSVMYCSQRIDRRQGLHLARASSVVNDRVSRVCMAYSQCASFLVQSFLLFEFDEGGEASVVLLNSITHSWLG